MELVAEYEKGYAFDEAVGADGEVREHYRPLAAAFAEFAPNDLVRRQRAAELFFLHRGTTFTVYGEKTGIDRIFPFDSIPRIIPADEWARVEKGLITTIRRSFGTARCRWS
jgi:uncharacterized circularly permuted ATP-grasp superfamily protein